MVINSGTVTVTDTNFYSNMCEDGSDIYLGPLGVSRAYQGTIKMSNCSFLCPIEGGFCWDSQIVAIEPIEWTCSLGSWAPSTGTIAGTNFTGCPFLCPAGTVGLTTDLTSANECTSCPTGQECPEDGMGAGLDCPPGMRAPGVGSQACLDCGPGTATNQTGQLICPQCVPGFATAAEGSMSCTACDIGEYASSNGTVACKACPAFSTTIASGATTVHECTCVQGYFFDLEDSTGRAKCQQCGNVLAFSTTNFAGATSADECGCIQGYFLEANATSRMCVACDPALMDCSIPGITLANMPIKPGGWRLSNTTSRVYPCFNPGACSPTAGNTTRRRRLDAAENGGSTAGNALCAPGHTGFLCGTCIEDWYAAHEAVCKACITHPHLKSLYVSPTSSGMATRTIPSAPSAAATLHSPSSR